MAATISAVVEPDPAEASVLLVTRRELAVLAVAVAIVVGAVLLLVLTSHQVVTALSTSG